MVVLGTIIGHLIGATLFEVQSTTCGWVQCLEVNFDVNAYRVLMRGTASAGNAPDIAFVVWLAQALALGPLTGLGAFWLARQEPVTTRLDQIAFGWLAPAVQAVKQGNSFITAYVLTKMEHDGLTLAYEGVVQHLALDEDQSVKLVVLNDVDRFLVRINESGIERINSPGNPITQLVITSAEITNIALEVIQAPDEDVKALEAADQGREIGPS